MKTTPVDKLKLIVVSSALLLYYMKTTPVDKLKLEWAGEVVWGFAKIITGNVKTGVSQIGKGLTNNAVGRFIAHKNDPNTIIRSIFAKDRTKNKTPIIPKIPVKSSEKSQLTISPKKKLLEKWNTPQKSPSPNNGLEKFLRGEGRTKKQNTIPELWKNYSEYYHNGKGAIQKFLKEKQGQVQGAFFRKEIGDITLPYGEMHMKNGKIQGYGLAKIHAKHGDEAIKKLPDIVNNGEFVKQSDLRYRIEKDGYVVGLAGEWLWNKQNVIITTFKKSGDMKHSFTDASFTTNSDNVFVNPALKNSLLKKNSNTSISKISEKSTKKLLHSYTNRNLDAPTISQNEAKAIVRKYFSDDQVSVQLADRIITNDGIEAFGMYKDRFIAFAKNPTKYTPEHEVFHAFFDMTLSPKEKNTILKGVMKEKGFKTKLDAEEFMADTFAEFVVGRREVQGITPRLKKIFADLAHMFKQFFGKEDKVEALYRELESIGKGKKEMLLKGKSDGKGKFQILKNNTDHSLSGIDRYKTPGVIKKFLEKRGYAVELHGSNRSKSEYMYITKNGSDMTMKIRVSDHQLPQKYYGSGDRNLADYEMILGKRDWELGNEIEHFFTHGKTKQKMEHMEWYKKDQALMNEVYSSPAAKEFFKKEAERKRMIRERRKAFLEEVGKMIFDNALAPTQKDATYFASKIFWKPGVWTLIPTLEAVESRLLIQWLVKYKKWVGIVRYARENSVWNNAIVADKGAKLLANTSKKFDESFRKISDEKMIKLQEKMKSPDLYKIRYNLSPKVKDFFRKNNIDQKIRHHIISNYWVRHILKQHGIHSWDKNPVTLEDIRHIPEIFSNPDHIFLSPKRNSRWQEVIIYEKKIWKFYYYFEDINTKTQQLETQTMYITDKRKNFK